MSIFAIADLHLSLAPDSDKPMDIFGGRWLNHADRLKSNWCERITDEDTVVIAGDISWALKLEDAKYDLDWIDELPGKKVVLKGNHDLWWAGINKLNKMYESITFLQNDSYSVEGIWICGSRGWITPADDEFTQADEKIYQRELLRLKASLDTVPKGEEIIAFLHYPPTSKYNSFSGFMQLFEDYAVKRVCYGHLHGEEAFKKAIQGEYHGVNYSLISVDYLNCKPLLLKA